MRGVEGPRRCLLADALGGFLAANYNVKIKSYTAYGYDETTGTGHATLTTTSGLPQHLAGSGQRGNLTDVAEAVAAHREPLNPPAWD